MKKLVLLIPLLFLSYKASSQQGTQKDSIVSLNPSVAREVIKDIIKGDGSKRELEQVKVALKLTREKINLKDQIISFQNTKINNLESIQMGIEEQLAIQKKITDQIEQELRAQKKKAFLYKLTTVVGVVTTGYLLIKQ